MVLLLEAAHHIQELVLALQHLHGVQAGDLAHAQVLLADVELLEVTAHQFLHGFASGGGEQLAAQLLYVDAADAGHALGHGNVPLGAGGGLEHNGVGQDGRRQQPRHIGRGHDAVFLIHTGDDGGGAAHGLVAHPDGLAGLDIRQAVVVDDLQNLRLIQARNGLGPLVVVHQHHALAPGAQQVIPGQSAHDFFVLVQHRVAAVAAFQHHLADVVDIVRQVEAHDLFIVAGPGDGTGLIDQPGHPAGLIGGGDDAGAPGVFQQVRVHLRLAQDQAADADVQGPADHIRLVAADDDVVRVAEQQVLAALGQGDDHVAGHGVDQVAAVVEQAALDDAEQVEQGHRLHPGVGDSGHAVGGDVAGGQSAVQGAVLVDNGDGGYLLFPHDVPGPVHGDRGVQGRGRIIVQVLHLGADVLHRPGGLEAEAVQHPLGLVADVVHMGGHIVPVAQGVAQGRVGHGGHDGIGIGVVVADDVDLVHRIQLLSDDSIIKRPQFVCQCGVVPKFAENRAP